MPGVAAVHHPAKVGLGRTDRPADDHGGDGEVAPRPKGLVRCNDVAVRAAVRGRIGLRVCVMGRVDGDGVQGWLKADGEVGRWGVVERFVAVGVGDGVEEQRQPPGELLAFVDVVGRGMAGEQLVEPCASLQVVVDDGDQRGPGGAVCHAAARSAPTSWGSCSIQLWSGWWSRPVVTAGWRWR